MTIVYISQRPYLCLTRGSDNRWYCAMSRLQLHKDGGGGGVDTMGVEDDSTIDPGHLCLIVHVVV